jgi:hypothetical protein
VWEQQGRKKNTPMAFTSLLILVPNLQKKKGIIHLTPLFYPKWNAFSDSIIVPVITLKKISVRINESKNSVSYMTQQP